MLQQLPQRDRLYLRAQRHLSYLFFPLVAGVALAWLKWGRRLSLRHPAAIRARFRELAGNANFPILVCSNHLTLVDSVILAWALAPVRGYLAHYDWLPWSVPEKANFAGTFFWRVAAFLGKCVYVTRGGDREGVRRTLNRIGYLLASGEMVCIFPEGGRSRTGRVDTENFTYGVGQIVQAVPETRVLCVYHRGRNQEGFSDYPARGDEYAVDLEIIRPVTESTGLRGARDMSRQIIGKLAEMEARLLADWK